MPILVALVTVGVLTASGFPIVRLSSHPVSFRKAYDPSDPEAWKHTALEPGRFAAFVEKYRQADALVLIGH